MFYRKAGKGRNIKPGLVSGCATAGWSGSGFRDVKTAGCREGQIRLAEPGLRKNFSPVRRV